MNRLFYKSLSTILLLGLSAFYSYSNIKSSSQKTNIPITNFEGIKPLLEKENDTTYVINFWATWCSPCVQEIPHFEKILDNFAEEKIEVILISLDFPNQYETRLIPFVEERQIRSKVILLDDPRANRWIPLVSPDWTGAIPATVIYNNKKREFYQKVFTYEELENEVLKFIN